MDLRQADRQKDGQTDIMTNNIHLFLILIIGSKVVAAHSITIIVAVGRAEWVPLYTDRAQFHNRHRLVDSMFLHLYLVFFCMNSIYGLQRGNNVKTKCRLQHRPHQAARVGGVGDGVRVRNAMLLAAIRHARGVLIFVPLSQVSSMY